MCRNSSCVAFLLARKCRSSTSRASHSRKCLRNDAQLAQAHRLHEAVGEVLGGDVEDAPVGAGAAQAGVDAFEQVRLAGADRAVQHERVGRLSRLLDDAQGGGVGDAVARADDELAQLVPAARGPGPRLDLLGDGLGQQAVEERGAFAAVSSCPWPEPLAA